MQFAVALPVRPRQARRLRSKSGAACPESKVLYHDDGLSEVEAFGGRYASGIYDLVCPLRKHPDSQRALRDNMRG